ncbi:MAG: 3-deoxy-manno-octulosonate cytidylyltransferase [Candidatus Delongbacteria bacterium]|nr:3-deoxy-manno-octulosonate cytidylyltransferase [Candidatus Delongbacteria bacterium]
MIPARYASSRFPGKPLAIIGGRPMILQVMEAVARSSLLSELYVLTDDERIAEVVTAAGGNAVMTDPRLPSGTDRIAAALATVPGDIFVNIQGDEPLIEAKVIDATVQALLADPKAEVATPVRTAARVEDVLSRNTAKVVVDQSGAALYFSRAPIPCRRDTQTADPDPVDFLLHVGLYVYRRSVLERFGRLKSRLEQLEKLEQLRFIENGIRVQTVLVDYSPLGVDTPEDLQVVEELLRQRSVREKSG